ncbi:LOW QUALITY PROTEIN: hypothetical protein M513_11342 [Trichuris suis]|uniref:Uncharacterized protein n=1 Tax=Trichuris suis TaxID=68888 RepID=A0A085LS46_9BILA|nr:LOW QUALITY PROTEIN: hypothetical protein M513_11342 [Trichuris suis]
MDCTNFDKYLTPLYNQPQPNTLKDSITSLWTPFKLQTTKHSFRRKGELLFAAPHKVTPPRRSYQPTTYQMAAHGTAVVYILVNIHLPLEEGRRHTFVAPYEPAQATLHCSSGLSIKITSTEYVTEVFRVVLVCI